VTVCVPFKSGGATGKLALIGLKLVYDPFSLVLIVFKLLYVDGGDSIFPANLCKFWFDPARPVAVFAVFFSVFVLLKVAAGVLFGICKAGLTLGMV